MKQAEFSKIVDTTKNFKFQRREQSDWRPLVILKFIFRNF